MNKKNQRLELKCETLRQLSNKEIRLAAGGLPTNPADTLVDEMCTTGGTTTGVPRPDTIVRDVNGAGGSCAS